MCEIKDNFIQTATRFNFDIYITHVHTFLECMRLMIAFYKLKQDWIMRYIYNACSESELVGDCLHLRDELNSPMKFFKKYPYKT